MWWSLLTRCRKSRPEKSNHSPIGHMAWSAPPPDHLHSCIHPTFHAPEKQVTPPGTMDDPDQCRSHTGTI